MAPPADASGHDSGAMAAVRGELSAVEALVAGYRDVSVCNINAPGQIVVGGPTAEIDRLVADSGERQGPREAAPRLRGLPHPVRRPRRRRLPRGGRRASP